MEQNTWYHLPEIVSVKKNASITGGNCASKEVIVYFFLKKKYIHSPMEFKVHYIDFYSHKKPVRLCTGGILQAALRAQTTRF